MKPDLDRVRYTLGGSFTPTVRILLWVNGFVFISLMLARAQMYTPAGVSYADVLVSLLGVQPHAVLREWAFWQPLTYLFVHREFWHLLFNMLAVWWFGSELEANWGTKKFLRYYLFTGIGAGVVSAFLNIPTIGASGSVYGLLLAYGLLFPERILYLYFVIPVKAKYVVFLFGAVEFAALFFAGGSGVNHAAHLSGLAFGLMWFAFDRRPLHLLALWRSYRRRHMRKRLRLIRKGDDDRDRGPFDSYSNRTLH